LQLLAGSDAAQQELLMSIHNFSSLREYFLSLVVDFESSLPLENVSQPVIHIHVERNQPHSLENLFYY
jgi:hypothetical protein